MCQCGSRVRDPASRGRGQRMQGHHSWPLKEEREGREREGESEDNRAGRERGKRERKRETDRQTHIYME